MQTLPGHYVDEDESLHTTEMLITSQKTALESYLRIIDSYLFQLDSNPLEPLEGEYPKYPDALNSMIAEGPNVSCIKLAPREPDPVLMFDNPEFYDCYFSNEPEAFAWNLRQALLSLETSSIPKKPATTLLTLIQQDLSSLDLKGESQSNEQLIEAAKLAYTRHTGQDLPTTPLASTHLDGPITHNKLTTWG